MQSHARATEKDNDALWMPNGDHETLEDASSIYSEGSASFQSYVVVKDIDVQREISKPLAKNNYFKQLSYSFYEKANRSTSPSALHQYCFDSCLLLLESTSISITYFD